MKTLINLLVFTFIFILQINSQGFNYQSIVRNASGVPQANMVVHLRFIIRDGSASGNQLYIEKQSPMTDGFGWLNVQVGSGNVELGNITGINWNSGPKFLSVLCGESVNGPFNQIANSQINYSAFAGPKGDTGAQGLKGDKGDTGAQGPQGATGQTGAKGDKGDNGVAGAMGLKGDKGDTGTQGPQGATGQTGAKGDKGDTGVDGTMGLKGDKGDTGAQGPQGATGQTGAKGDKGDTGVAGAMGLKGDKGDTGVAGAMGLKGDKGDPGDASNAWRLTGNAGTNAAINFMGTTDNQDVIFKRNNLEKMVLGTSELFVAENLFVKKNITTSGRVQLGTDISANETGQMRYNASTNDFEGFNGSIWKSFTTTGSGLVLPYSADYGGATNPAFRINVQNNNTGIEVNNIALSGATRPAIKATSTGLATFELEGKNSSEFNTTAFIHNQQVDNRGIALAINSVGPKSIGLSVSTSGMAGAFIGSTTGDSAVVDILNLGLGKGLIVKEINPNATDNALRVNSSSKGSAVHINIANTQNPPTNALELTNGYIKVNQTVPNKTVFVHTTSVGNVSGNATILTYPGAASTDIIFIQKRLPYIGTSVLVWYDNVISSWKIATENISNMPVNVQFNVLVFKTQ